MSIEIIFQKKNRKNFSDKQKLKNLLLMYLTCKKC